MARESFATPLRNALVCALLLASCVALGGAVALEKKLALSADRVNQLVADTDQHLSVTLSNADRLIIIAGATATEAQKASKEERQYLASLNRKVSRDLDDVHELLQDTRVTLAMADTSIADIQPLLQDAQQSVTSLQPVLAHANEAAAGVSKIANDPNIAKTLSSVQQTTDSVNRATQKTEQFVTHKLDELEKPKKWFVSAWKDLLEAAYYAKGVIF